MKPDIKHTTPAIMPTSFHSFTLIVLVAVLLSDFVATGQALVFKSDRVDAHWDTWAYEHEGTYYRFIRFEST
jgi:hypothetical protein